jgi:AcrR family transcriptional regulator
MKDRKEAGGVVARSSVDTILSAARSEFGRLGLSGARISNIAQNCGKTKQLIYHYYQSKDELFSDVVWDCLQQSMRNMQAHDYAGMPPAKAFHLFLITMSDQYRLFPEWIPIMLDENIHGGVHLQQRKRVLAVTQPVVDIFANIIARGTATGDFKADLDVERLYAAALGILTTCYFCGGVLSAFLPLDLTSNEGVEAWQHYAVGLMVDSVIARAEVSSAITGA